MLIIMCGASKRQDLQPTILTMLISFHFEDKGQQHLLRIKCFKVTRKLEYSQKLEACKIPQIFRMAYAIKHTAPCTFSRDKVYFKDNTTFEFQTPFKSWTLTAVAEQVQCIFYLKI